MSVRVAALLWTQQDNFLSFEHDDISNIFAI